MLQLSCNKKRQVMLDSYWRKTQNGVQHISQDAARSQPIDIKLLSHKSEATCSILQVYFHFFLLFLFSFSLFLRFPLFLTFLPALCCKRRKKRKEAIEITALLQRAAFFKYAARHFSKTTHIYLQLKDIHDCSIFAAYCSIIPYARTCISPSFLFGETGGRTA